jgi:signal peptidase I
MIIFPYPQDPTMDYIQGLVGLGGEIGAIRNQLVFIDGEQIEAPYAIHTDHHILPDATTPRDNLPPLEIPEGYIFGMGDHRDNSNDSRIWGLGNRNPSPARPFSLIGLGIGRRQKTAAIELAARSIHWVR